MTRDGVIELARTQGPWGCQDGYIRNSRGECPLWAAARVVTGEEYTNLAYPTIASTSALQLSDYDAMAIFCPADNGAKWLLDELNRSPLPPAPVSPVEESEEVLVAA
jgi:hypothetical protein